MNDKFLVSIIIPVYNGKNYLKQAINSALNQTYENIEVIVVDDGSTDNTEVIAKKFKNKIKYIKKENGGVASALNLGIKSAKGQYISWLSHDDLYDQRKIEVEMNKIYELKNDMALVTCNYDFIDENGNFLYSNKLDQNILKTHNSLIYLFNFVINGCALLINKKYFETYGLFDESLPSTQDFDMWFRIFRKNNVYFIDETLVHSRVHEEQGSKKFEDTHVEECTKLWVGFFESLSKKEKKDIYGTEYDFYKNVLDTLKKYVNYPKVFEYLQDKKLSLMSENENIAINYIKSNYNIKNDINKSLFEKSNKSKIMFGCFGKWDDRGGLNRVVANIANGLSNYFTVYIITSGNINVGYELNSNIKIINLEFTRFDKVFIKKIYDLIKILNIDVYINPYNCLNIFIDLMSYLKEKNVKVIAWNHEYYFLPYLNSAYSSVIANRNKVFSHLDLVMWLTSASNVVYGQLYNNSIVMPNAMTINHRLNRSDFSDNSIIGIGRFDDPRKCAEDFIILAKKLKDRNIKVKIKLYGNYDLSLIGEKTKIELSELLKDYKLNKDDIEFMGFVKDIEKIYKKSKLHIILSYHEGFGLTIIESASYGIPTIAYNDSGFEDMIINNKNGFLIERNNFDDLVEKIIKIYNDNKLFEKLSNNAQEYSKKYTYSNIIDNWKNIIENIINNSILINYNSDTNIDYKLVFHNAVFEYEKSIQKLLKNNLVLKELEENDNIIKLQEELYNVYNSKSWKITQPLRDFRTKFKKKK